ncbi:nitrite reductase large subunit NirB [Flavihumibacter sp. UBA7668]|uniref:nitrite reductase large subunit NirB n=1 Tax=Flavihumibacter sp. UBA7668 TaxID=1946542 RepID=UPI0025B97441|nr:nitrite reductase large subunit NirB [Flavihumibacter sp. UBA7668]
MKVVIIGNGMVGFKCCEKLLHYLGDQVELIVFGEESRPAYDRVHLSDYFSHFNAEELELAPISWYQEKGITLHLGDPVVLINREEKNLVSHSGKETVYDFLVLATGSSAFVPPIPGTEKPGVFIYRTIEDLELIRDWSKKARSAAVLGGGLLGLEAGKALLDLGITNTHIIEFAPRLMPRQIDAAGSEMLSSHLEKLGLTIHTSKQTAAIEGEDQISGLRFQDDSRLQVDMLVISAGIKPRDELARLAGLELGHRGGILVNDLLQTSDPSIFAIGECALHNGMIYGLVAPGYDMADILASQLAGNNRHFTGFDMSTKLKLIGVDVASFGDPMLEGPDTRIIRVADSINGVYKRINLSADGKKLLGGVLVGDASSYNQLVQVCKGFMPLPEKPEELILGSKTGGSAAAGIAALAEDAIICSCEGISKKSIIDAVNQGNESFDSIKKCTGAGSGCGGCTPMVKDILQAELKAKGKLGKVVVCEHFGYSRQELFDIIKIKKLQSYDEVLDTAGKGDGCEICKPLVVSLLASIWNDMILKKGNDTAQDSNDRFLANIQKGGTYSVVPRIPGGEITPDKLLVIGSVAKKYGLYTKITGGQRIDLFGAHLDDLPFIWEELIEAGFESGHAYGKALRTVKSCVGSTWCRFGLHDSVSFAIRIEERYRGIRAPHKIKSAVSGCIRECAEAQSKDFGLIATEKGWNLFVAGNGGSKPQHAVLLASDIDEATCIKYIDRFLMFYIKTADPLTRTATWLNKLEGGLAYLKEVILEDSLGIADELEAEMQGLVDNYQCEWKEAINNPEIRKRFQHFVNAPGEKDPTVQFDPMRSQKRAMEWK